MKHFRYISSANDGSSWTAAAGSLPHAENATVPVVRNSDNDLLWTTNPWLVAFVRLLLGVFVAILLIYIYKYCFPGSHAARTRFHRYVHPVIHLACCALGIPCLSDSAPDEESGMSDDSPEAVNGGTDVNSNNDAQFMMRTVHFPSRRQLEPSIAAPAAPLPLNSTEHPAIELQVNAVATFMNTMAPSATNISASQDDDSTAEVLTEVALSIPVDHTTRRARSW